VAKVRDFIFCQKDPDVVSNKKLQETVFSLKVKRPQHHWHSNTAGHI